VTAKGRVLVVDDEAAHAELLGELVARHGFEVVTETGHAPAVERLRREPFDLVITDLDLDGHRGTEILELARTLKPAPEVMLVSGVGSIEDAVESLQLGATHYFTKPLQVPEVRRVLDGVAERIRQRRQGEVTDLEPYQPGRFEGLLGQGPAMQAVFETIRKIAGTSATVLITGENGTGKELVAKAIHALSPRRSAPFVALNCASLSEGVLESELFGHEKGAFTGASRTREGMFEFADHGTLFLDEVGDMPISVQVKLLRVIQEREIVRVGSNRTIKVDVRLIAATNKDLRKAIAAGTFREDLYWRLKVVHVHMPSLRERREDIPLLVEHFLAESCARHGKPPGQMDDEAMAALVAAPWPGNVRELQNAIEHVVVMGEGPVYTRRELPADSFPGDRPGANALVSLDDIGNWTLERLERELIRLQLDRASGNRARAAKALGISERTLYRKLRAYGLS
jgi:DNA-binding NtrC family response regulator